MISRLPFRHGGPRALSIVVSSPLFRDRVAVADPRLSEGTEQHVQNFSANGAESYE